MGLLVCLGIPKYMNIFVWEHAVTLNGHNHSGNTEGKVVPNAHGNPRLIIFESIRELAYKKISIRL